MVVRVGPRLPILAHYGGQKVLYSLRSSSSFPERKSHYYMRRTIPPLPPLLLLAISVLLVVIAPSSAAKAQEPVSSIGKESLRGLKGVWVLVAGIDKDVERNGLTESQLRTDAKLKLRKAGIHVVTSEESRSNNIGMLHIDVGAIQLREAQGVYVFSITVELIQDVRLPRAPSNAVFSAITYYVPHSCGTVGADHIRDELRNSVNDKVDVFLNDYLTMNPK